MIMSHQPLALTFDSHESRPHVPVVHMSVNVSPAVVKTLRQELAAITREFADQQEPKLRKVLMQIADAFESRT